MSDQVVETATAVPTATSLPNACTQFADIVVPETAVPPASITAATTPPPRHAVHTLFVDATIANLAVEAGFDTIVQVLPWREVHPAPDQFEWAMADALVQTVRQSGLNLVLRLDMPPEWAAQNDPAGLPFNLAAYGEFVTAVAQRYQSQILGYIIWNEPNLAAEWSRSGGNLEDHWASFDGWVAEPADYVGVLGVAFRQIRAADPQALVVGGGLAPTNEISPRAVDDRIFLEQLWAAGMVDCIDVLAVHAYGFGLSPDAPDEIRNNLNLGRIAQMHNIMQAADLDKPIWITELGYTVTDGNQPAVSKGQQADYLLAARARAEAEWPWVQLFTVWNLVYGRSPHDEMGGYSLINPDLSPRPAFFAWRQETLSEDK
ncbi:endo-1,4-beta-xylanase [Candidatus Leptofilum sp.]|uniref:endo-1,4-beta-xylanase n=1 Tax=Candidatus Leptofilum sp. TaxID=3241576 RepID=UPI003B5B465B